METTQPGIWHIHLDTTTVSEMSHNRIAKELGFYAHNFTGHPDGFDHFEPTRHSTLKLYSKNEYMRAWEAAMRIVGEEEGLEGYLEGEHVPTDERIPEAELRDFAEPDFKVLTRRLRGTPKEQFRESELHLVMDFDRSRRVADAFLRAGFYGALLQKKDHRAVVLTMQGDRKPVRDLIVHAKRYIARVGGAYRATIKEERVVKHKLFLKDPWDLPPIVDHIVSVGA